MGTSSISKGDVYISDTEGTVTSVSGTPNRIDVTNPTIAPIVDISATYIGQSSLTTLGTITTGTWNGTLIGGTYGGTGVNNGSNTITLSGNLATSGAFTTTLTVTGNTNVTFPTSGTLVNSGVTTLSSLTSIGTIGTGVWQGTKINLAYGGTNADLSATGGTSQVLKQSSSGAAITVGQLAASDLSNGTTGSGSVVLAASPALSGNPTTVTQSSTDNSTKIASTAYVTTAVANAIAGVNPAVAVQAATTQASDTSGLTYNNGVAGIGATLIGLANTALTWDGYTFTAIGQRGLVKNDTQSPSGAFNGMYYVTQIQTALLPIILTRALDYDAPSDINNTGAIPVVNGTVNALTSWLLTSQVTTVGTDPLTYTKFSSNPVSILSSTLTNTHVFVGNSSNVATDVAVSGDATMANTGALTVSSIGGKTVSLANSLTTSGNFAPTLTFTATTNSTFPAGTKTLVATDVTTLSSLASIGTITAGVWNGTIITSGYGGTGNGFTKFSGATTSEKTYALPDASTTILTTNAAVTVAQGGTGAATLTGVLKGNGTSAFTAATSGTDYSAGTSGLATGIIKSTTTTGALTIAVAGDFPTLNQNTSGSAATLTTPRTIGGVNFDGSANIVPQTIQSVNEASDTTCFPLFISASGTQSLQPLNNTSLIFNASSGAFGATSFSGAGTGITGTAASLTAGNVTTNANLTGVITSSGNATSIASQTGTGTKFVVDTSPTLVTPLLGTPTSGVLTNCTGTASGLTAGAATILSTARAIYGNNFDGSAALTAIIASTYGGTGNGFTKFSGATTSEKTYTLPNASCNVLTDNAVVTTAQGGTGIANNAASTITISGNFGTTFTVTGTTSVTLPTSGTLTTLATVIGTANTWTAVQTFTNSDIRLLGSSTGYTTFTSANAGASNYTLTFPAVTDTVTTNTGSAIAFTGGNIDGVTLGATTQCIIQGYRPVNTQTGTTYTLVLGDNGKKLTLNNASAITLTIPTNASVAFAIGTEIDIAQLGAGQVTVSPSGGVTLNSYTSLTKLAGQYAGGTLWKTDTNTWLLVGNLA